MWQAFMDWLPDLRVGTIEIRDLVSLTVGALGVYLAYLAIKLGKEQAKIAGKQAAIAETQDRLMQEQLSRRPDLKITMLHGMKQSDGRLRFDIFVYNRGNEAARDFYWDILIASRVYKHVHLVIHGAKASAELNEITESDPERRVVVAGFYDRPVYPRRNILLGYALVEHQAIATFSFEWAIQSAHGTFPDGDRFGVTEPGDSSSGGESDWFTRNVPVDNLSTDG